MCFKNNQNLTLFLETVKFLQVAQLLFYLLFKYNGPGVKFPNWPSKAYVKAQRGRAVTTNLPVFLDVQAASLCFTSLPLPHTIRLNTDTITLVWSCSWQSDSHINCQ